MNRLGPFEENTIISHRQLVDLALQTLRHRYDLVATEFPPYKQGVVFDFIGFSRLRKEIRIIECKTNRADFLADDKWKGYMPYCTHLAFLGPKEVFFKEELPKEIGVIRPRLAKLRNGTLKMQWYYERGCKRLGNVSANEYLAILEGFAGQYALCSWNCQKRGQKPRYRYD